MSSSDLAERLPLFNAYVESVDSLDQRSLDFVPPDVIRAMRHCVPAGVNPDNTLDIPKQYEPQEGPLILPLRKDENLTVRWSDGMEKVARHVFGLADVRISDSVLAIEVKTSPATGALTGFSLCNGPSGVDIMVPMFTAVRPAANAITRAMVLGHETNHWDFFMHTAPGLRLNQGLSMEQVGALSEKWAYAVDYDIKCSQGQHALFMSADELAKQYLVGLGPQMAGKEARRVITEHWRRPGGTTPLPIDVGVKAMSLCFADKDPAVLISDDEITAYRALGVLEANWA